MVQTANPEINQIHVDVIIGQDISQPLNFSLVMANHQYPPSLTQPLFNLSQGTLPLVFLNQKISRFEIMENRRIKGAAVILGLAGWKGARGNSNLCVRLFRFDIAQEIAWPNVIAKRAHIASDHAE